MAKSPARRTKRVRMPAKSRRGSRPARAAKRARATNTPVVLTRSVVAFTDGAFREVTWPQWLRKMPYAGLRQKLREGGYELLSRNAPGNTFVLSRHLESGALVAWLLVGMTVTPCLIPKHIDLVQFRVAWR
jgi:hypothetical protein